MPDVGPSSARAGQWADSSGGAASEADGCEEGNLQIGGQRSRESATL